MILPSKHIRFSESLLGLGAFLVDILKEENKTVDELWLRISKLNNSSKLPAYHSFDNVVLSLNYLFAIGVVEIGVGDKIYLIQNDTKN